MQVLAIPKKKRIYAIAFSPSGRDLAAVCGDGRVRVWDTTTGEIRQIASVEETSCGFDLLYLDERTIVVAGRALFTWDLAANEWHTVYPGQRWARQLALSPDGRFIAEVDQTQSTDWPNPGLLLYATADWHGFPVAPDAANSTGGLAFSPDGQSLATSHIVRVGAKQRYLSIPSAFRAVIPPDQTALFELGPFSVNEYDYVVCLRQVPSCQTARTIPGWGQGVRHLAFSPDGSILAGTAGPRLRVWDLDNDREIALHRRGPKHFQGLSFTSDGRYLATVSNDETVRLWDARTWVETKTFTWNIGRLLNIEFAPDGLRAAAGSDRGKIVVWDVEE